MKTWTTLILWASCSLATQHVVAQAANIKIKEVFQLMHHHPHQMMMQSQESHAREHRHQDRLPTQPIHRSILSHRKQTFLHKKDNIANQNNNWGSSLRVAQVRRTLESTENRGIGSSNKNEDEQSQPYDEQASPMEPTNPLLASEWWVKISEETGRNSWNYIPESRRAASSVVFVYKYDKDRLLAEQGGGIVVENKGTHNASEALEQGGENVVDRIDGILNNATESIDHEVVEVENKADNSTTSDQGDEVEADTTNSVLNNATERTPEEGPSGNAHDHSASSELPNQQAQGSTTTAGEEYMIISGGYTDHDWKTFPVYGFPITSSIISQSGQWVDLSPSAFETNIDSQCNEEDGAAAREKLYQETDFFDADTDGSADDLWEHAQHCSPSGRMGHQSVIHNDRFLYVFGGLIYDEEQTSGGYGRKQTFRLEDVPFVYRLDLKEMFDARREERKGNRSTKKVTGWQRIIPRVKPFPTPAGMSSTSAAEVLLTSVNRGEMQGGLWSSGSPGGHDKFVMYGGLRIARLEYEGYGHNVPSKFVKGQSTFGSSQMHSHKIVELPLGDVWTYDLNLDCWEKITNNYGKPIEDGEAAEDNDDTAVKNEDPDDDYWYDVDISLYPRPRTAHAATLVGNDLIIHGGMGWNEHTNDWDGSTDWETLDDMWILDLNSRQWTRRWLFPLLVRSYHSLVGWQVDEHSMGWAKEFENMTTWDGPVVAAFGGYTKGIDVFSGEELAYVFDDLLLSYPPVPRTNFDEPPSPWLKASMSLNRDGAELISTRYEHSAVLSEQGVLVVWGGSFQDTKSVKGMWMINIAGSDSNVNVSMAEADSIYNDYEKTITALHTIVLLLMFMSISLTLLLGLTQRYQELVQQANDDAAVAAGITFAAEDFGNDPQPTHRGNGLHPEIIDTIPRKIYSTSENIGNEGGGEGEQECCPICLLEYTDGDELRVLPCDHFMHTSCLDAWLANNPSCPSCRYDLSELVDDRPMMQLRTIRSHLSNNLALARFLGHDHPEEGIEMGEMTGNVIDESLQGQSMFDRRYISSLALTEEDTAAEPRGETQQEGGNSLGTSTHTTAMEELRSWRSRRRQLQRDRRRPRLASLRQIRSNPRSSRVPLADTDED
ncbi:hypothetical protein ACHAXR_011799 [Thalassiosira sp. AJA248-18]